MSAILFGSISTLADTSELQRKAFNQAFAESGLEWNWSRDDYRAMLAGNGGAQRIADYAQSRGDDVDASQVHATKSQIFQRLLTTETITLRPGVLDTVTRAKEQGAKVGFVTTTSKENIDALLSALSPDLTAESFDIIVDRSSVQQPKPDAESYAYALGELGESADHAVAIEDNSGGVKAAAAAGVSCVAFPNENTVGGDFGEATATVDALDPERIVILADS